MPLLPATRASLKTLYNALADRILAPEDPVYVKELNCKGASGADPIEEIATEIDWQQGGGVCLFTGQRGTGKSTELQRLQKTPRTARHRRVLCRHGRVPILLTKPIEISDFLISISGALSDRIAADRRFGQNLAGLSYWDRLKNFLQTKVEFKEVSAKLGAVDIKAALKGDPDFKEKLQMAARGHVTQLVRESHLFLEDAVTSLRQNPTNSDLKVALLVDSVERVRGVGGDETMKVFESVRDLFFGHAEHLRIPFVHLVYTVPPYLSVLAPAAGSLMGGATVRRLVSTHIFEDRSRESDNKGLALLRGVIEARYSEWRKIFSQEALDRLALSSGGDLREFFRLLRLCLPAVQDDAQLPLSAEAVAHAENAARTEMLPIPSNHLAWLKRIAKSHAPCLKEEADLPLLAHFLDNRLVLNYRNGDDWYDVHPLLRKVVDAYERDTTTT